MVVENFSYVFQASAGAAKSITREEMRLFKQTWAEYANSKTGYLERSNFVPFFGVCIEFAFNLEAFVDFYYTELARSL